MIRKSIKYTPPKVGYNPDFWNHCLETDKKKEIAFLDQSNASYRVLMRCDRDHISQITPYEFFIQNIKCDYCVKPGEIGAVNVDESIRVFWNDERYDIETISETSNQNFKLKCPFCNKEFHSTMIKFVKKQPKCTSCNDGQKGVNDEVWDNLTYWVK